jgi:hypothetical protein
MGFWGIESVDSEGYSEGFCGFCGFLQIPSDSVVYRSIKMCAYYHIYVGGFYKYY